MKRMLCAAVLAVVCGGLRAGDNALIAGALKDETVKACVQAAKEPGYEIVSQVSTVSICFVSGSVDQVSFYKVLRCNETGNNGPCPKPAAVLVATAEFGCAGELTSGMCY